MQNNGHFTPTQIRSFDVGLPSSSRFPFAGHSSFLVRSITLRDPMCYSEKPATEWRGGINALGLFQQNEELSLERIIEIRRVREDLQACGKYRLAVSIHKHSKSGLIPVTNETCEQLLIRFRNVELTTRDNPECTGNTCERRLGHNRTKVTDNN